MRRVRVVLLWVLGVAAGLALVGWVGLKMYLGSSQARQLAATKISEAIGLPVEVERLDVGTESTTAALQIPDAAGEPLLRIGSLHADVTLAGLLTGRVAPTTVTLNDVDLLFRLDADGTILSPLPKLKDTGSGGAGGTAVPAVSLANSRVRIRQVGKPEFVVAGVSGRLRRDGDGYAITGDIDDPAWGKWRTSGRLAADPADGRVELAADRAELKHDLLRTIPYVPPEVWDHLSASGPTGATVAFTFRPGADLGYAVDLTPQRASLTVPDAGVTVTDVEGKIRVADGQVTVTDGRLALADGRVTGDAVYRFDRPTPVITLKLTATGVDVRRLPADWGLPKEIAGRLKGSADLEVRLPPGGKLETSGGGSGEIVGARLAGLDAEIKLFLKGDGGRFRFSSGEPAGR